MPSELTSSLLTGYFMDRSSKPLTTLTVFALTIAAILLLAVSPASLAASILAGAVLDAAISGSQTVLYSIAPSGYPTDVRGTSVGAAVAGGRVGSAIGPLLAGLPLGSCANKWQVLMTLLPIIAGSGIAATWLSVRAGQVRSRRWSESNG